MTFFDELFIRYPQLETCRQDILNAYELIEDVFVNNGKLLLCGNGGSAADCSHIAGELLKSFKRKRPVSNEFRSLVGDDIANNLQGAVPAISLPEMLSINTAFCNDCDPQYNFAQLVYGIGCTNDALLAISTSGNSKNINLAAVVAKAKKMKIIGLTGQSGGTLLEKCNVCIRAPECETFKIQELHLPIYHAICLMLENKLFE